MTETSFPILLFLESFDEELLSTLRESQYELANEDSLNSKRCERVIAIFTKVSRTLTSQFIEKFPNLRYVVVPATGVDLIDVESVRRHGATLLNLRSSGSPVYRFSSTTEIFFWLLLSICRKANLAASDVLDGNWKRERFIGTNLRGKRIGVLGMGRIGNQIASLCKILGMKVFAYDINPSLEYPHQVTEVASLNELIAQVEILSINVDDRISNKELVNANVLSYANQIMIVNTSRGFVVEEKAILDALRDGRVLAYAADVLMGEGGNDGWLQENPLWQGMSREQLNIVLTPHIGGATKENIYESEKFVINKFLELERSNG